MSKQIADFSPELIFPFWERLNSDERALLVRQLRRRLLEADCPLQADCSGRQELVYVEKGLLRVYLLSPEGREVTLYRVYPGEFCVLSVSSLLEQITFDIFIRADETTELVCLGLKAVSSLITQNLHVENFMYRQSAMRFSDVVWSIQQILFMRFDERLASFLISESRRTGSSTILMTHEHISRQLGSAREVVSRMLGHFAADGLVEIFRGGIRILDHSGLACLIQHPPQSRRPGS